jgi:hypothetical protein
MRVNASPRADRRTFLREWTDVERAAVEVDLKEQLPSFACVVESHREQQQAWFYAVLHGRH